MEIDVPEAEVILSDFDSWSIILLHGLLSDSEEEDKRLEQEYENLSEESRQEYREANWERAFELSYVDNDWVYRGDSIQATFWELRKEHIRKVRFFTSATPKPDYLDENGGTRNEG
nr:DUF3841 domain-containing protein [uncultured Shuttleworthia sp.]